MNEQLTCPKCLADEARPGGDSYSAHTRGAGCRITQRLRQELESPARR